MLGVGRADDDSSEEESSEEGSNSELRSKLAWLLADAEAEDADEDEEEEDEEEGDSGSGRQPSKWAARRVRTAVSPNTFKRDCGPGGGRGGGEAGAHKLSDPEPHMR